MTRASPTADDGVPEEAVLKRLRIPFVRKAVLVRAAGREDVFVIDLGLEGVFIERADELPVGEEGDLTLPWP
ncbi:MAG TPA: hypothetical protein VI589_11475, partial [Vicinamibacteria bacterium]